MSIVTVLWAFTFALIGFFSGVLWVCRDVGRGPPDRQT